MAFTPSVYQQGVYDHIASVVNGRTQGRHLRVDALAGSGKTTTAKRSLDLIPLSQQIMMTAFNKRIAQALQGELPFNAEAMTMHSFGNGILSSYGRRRPQLNKWKTDFILENYIYDMRNERGKFFKEKGAISKIVGLFKAEGYYAQPEPSDAIAIVDKYGIELPGRPSEISAKAIEAFEIGKGMTEVIDFDDMIFLPMYLEIPIPKYQWLYIDELQDNNKVQTDLLIAAGSEGTIVGIGDRHQSIYGFRGAMQGIMDLFVEQLAATCLPLSICYRCPKAVVRQAKKFVPQIEWADWAEDGTCDTVKVDFFLKNVTDGHYVLCRNTEPLIGCCLRFIREGRKAIVLGRDIGQNLMVLLTKIDEMGRAPDLMGKISAYRAQEIARLSALRNGDELIGQLEDRLVTIEALIGHIGPSANLRDLERLINKIFEDEASGDGITFMTIHKAKGLEAKFVWGIRPDLLPSRYAKTDWALQQERNLGYVQVTRAQQQFMYVQGHIPRD